MCYSLGMKYFILLFVSFTANSEPKNLVIWEVRRDYTHIDHVQTANGVGAEVHKRPIQGIMYYRANSLDTLGFGVGVDANGTVKGAIGIGF